MVKTVSTMLPLGSWLPVFELPLVKKDFEKEDSLFNLKDQLNNNMIGSQPVLFMFLCAHCPFVKHIEGAITSLHNDFASGIDFIGVASNFIETHPEDGPQFLNEQIAKNYWKFPYLLDFEQKLAKSLRAACTPDFFLFNFQGDDPLKLVYRGQFDDSRPTNNIPPTGSVLRAAIEAVLEAKELTFIQKPSIGCNIKWIPGREPSWFK